MTLREFLRSITPYTIPDAYITAIGEELGENIDTDYSNASPAFANRARARVYLYLATTPNISEGGVSISFSATEKQAFLDLAKRYAKLGGETGLVPGGTFGYKGQNI